MKHTGGTESASEALHWLTRSGPGYGELHTEKAMRQCDRDVCLQTGGQKGASITTVEFPASSSQLGAVCPVGLKAKDVTDSRAHVVLLGGSFSFRLVRQVISGWAAAGRHRQTGATVSLGLLDVLCAIAGQVECTELQNCEFVFQFDASSQSH